jgi:hypothetical protein
MSIPPRLASKLNTTLGAEAAGDLVSWLDEMRAEHMDLREAMRADFAEMRQEMRAMESRIKDELGGRIHALELKVEQRSADLIKWSFVFWVSAVAAIATLAGVLR